MDLSKRQLERAEKALAEALNRPVRRCPNCGVLGAHWVPDHYLDELGIVPGYFDCDERDDGGS